MNHLNPTQSPLENFWGPEADVITESFGLASDYSDFVSLTLPSSVGISEADGFSIGENLRDSITGLCVSLDNLIQQLSMRSDRRDTVKVFFRQYGSSGFIALRQRLAATPSDDLHLRSFVEMNLTGYFEPDVARFMTSLRAFIVSELKSNEPLSPSLTSPEGHISDAFQNDAINKDFVELLDLINVPCSIESRERIFASEVRKFYLKYGDRIVELFDSAITNSLLSDEGRYQWIQFLAQMRESIGVDRIAMLFEKYLLIGDTSLNLSIADAREYIALFD